MIISVIIPLCCGLISALLCMGLLTKHQPNPQWNSLSQKQSFVDCLKPFLPVMLMEWLVFLGCAAAVSLFMFTDKNKLPPMILAIAAILPFAARLTAIFVPHEKLSRLAHTAAGSMLVLFALETFVCNFKSFSTGKTDVTVSPESISLEAAVAQNDDGFIVSGLSALVMNELPPDAHALILDLETTHTDASRRFKMTLSMKDDNYHAEFTGVRKEFVSGFNKEYILTFTPYGKLDSLRLMFDNITEPVTLRSIRAVSAAPFRFSAVRFFCLFALVLFCAFVRIYEIYRLKISDKSPTKKLMLDFMTILCVFSTVFFIYPKFESSEYIFDFNYSGADQYTQVFNAWMHGRTDLNITPSPELKALPNPYDYPSRIGNNVDYYWDFAYKDGKYYSYFGAAPVLTFYFPFYFLSFGKIPTQETVNFVFGTLAILFLCLTLRAAAKKFLPDANFLLFLLMLPVSVCTTGIYYMLSFSDNYSLPMTAGLCYLFLCLWLGITACDTKHRTKRNICLFFSGLALACCAGSRPTMAVCAAPLIPLFLGILTRRDEKLRHRLANAGFFAAPLLVGVGLILFYNKLRFGSFLDFGAAYQLTVSNVSANKLDLRQIPGMIYAYFLQTPRPISTFPYFEPEFYGMFNHGKYFYEQENIGIFTYPFILLGTLYLPYGLLKRKSPEPATGKIGKFTVLQKNAFLIICFAAAFVIAWADFCMGGVIRRYTFDCLPLLTIASTITVLRANQNEKADKVRYFITIGALAWTFTYCLLLELQQLDGGLSINNPTLFESVAGLSQFWR